MFHIDATFEDIRVIADGIPLSTSGINYDCSFMDHVTGATREIRLTDKQLSMIIQINLDNNGEPVGYEAMYEELEPIFKDWPNELRPIP